MSKIPKASDIGALKSPLGQVEAETKRCDEHAWTVGGFQDTMNAVPLQQGENSIPESIQCSTDNGHGASWLHEQRGSILLLK